MEKPNFRDYSNHPEFEQTFLEILRLIISRKKFGEGMEDMAEEMARRKKREELFGSPEPTEDPDSEVLANISKEDLLPEIKEFQASLNNFAARDELIKHAENLGIKIADTDLEECKASAEDVIKNLEELND